MHEFPTPPSTPKENTFPEFQSSEYNRIIRESQNISAENQTLNGFRKHLKAAELMLHYASQIGFKIDQILHLMEDIKFYKSQIEALEKLASDVTQIWNSPKK